MKSEAVCLALLFVWAILPLAAPVKGADNDDRIRPWGQDSRYWQYKGEPVLLLGGSQTDHIFLWEDLKAHLEEIAAVGGNYVRNTMSQREGIELKAHRLLPDGKFDIDQWNEEYWRRFENCLQWCLERDIIMQIEVWDRFDFSQEHWQNSPWNPAMNVNYSASDSGLAHAYPAPAWRDRQPFFHTIKGMAGYKPKYDMVRRHQERFVEKMLSYSLTYPNVLYCMNNETSTDPQWGRYWMQFIEARAKAAGVDVYVTDMFDDVWAPQKSKKLRQAFNTPNLYEFIDVSQVNSRTFNEGHWTNISWITSQNGKHPRPLNCTKIYSDGQTNWGSGTPIDGVERFWRNLIAGCASARFHRPGGGIGLNDTAKACIGAAREVEAVIKLWEVEPKMDLLSERQTDEAYLAAQPGEKYLLYFTDGGSVKVDLSHGPGTLRVTWVDIATGQRHGQETLRGGSRVQISPPGSGGWAAAILKVK